MNKLSLSFTVIFLLAANIMQAQSPGGVSTNLSVWLKADNTSTLSPSTGSLNSWTYSNPSIPGSNSYTAAAGRQPTVAPNTFNFLPSIAFNGTQFMSGPAGITAPIPSGQLNYSVFAVWSSTTPTGNTANENVWTQRPNSSIYDQNGDGAALWINPSNGNGATYGDQPEILPFTTSVLYVSATTPNPPYGYTGPILTYAPNTPYISELNLLNQNSNDLELMDQTNYATGPGVTSTDPAGNATADRNLSNEANLLGARSTQTTPAFDEPFFGNLAELIIYAGNVSAAQRSAIFSYLALKYGISLGGSYVSSAGATIWNAANAASWGFGSMNYNHSIFGLGDDNGSGLSVAQSNSLSTGKGNGSGQFGKGNIVLSNPSTLTDGAFMIIGSNNAGFNETTTNLPSTSPTGAKRLTNQWLVQNTGSVGTVNFSFDFTGITTTGTIGTSSDFALVVDHDGDGDFSTGTQSVYAPSSWNGNVAIWSGVTLNGSSNTAVFSILSNSNGTPLPVTWVDFTAQANGPDVNLNWTVGDNGDAKNYEVQHSTDGKSFTTIGQVSNQADIKSYSFVHANAGPGTHYYRVLETDLDGASIYSKIVSVKMSGSGFAIRLINNPVVGDNRDAELEITANNTGNASLEIWNMSGMRVSALMQSLPNGTSRIRLPMTSLAAGTYVVKIRVNDFTQTVQVVKLQ